MPRLLIQQNTMRTLDKRRAWLAILVFNAVLWAQTSILDQVENGAERNAFAALYEERDALKRRSLAANFLHSYPSSWLLAPIHEAAAKAAADMGDLPSAVFHARESLRLYPENPGLLVPFAAWQARRDEKRAAESSASEALRYLNLFVSPSGKVRDELRAVALSIAPEPLSTPGVVAGKYAGSAICGQCHRAEYAAWKSTGMANMLRPLEKARVIGDFAKRAFGDFRVGTADRPFIELRRRNGEWDRYPVAFTIGSKWQQAYAVRDRGGDLHVLPVQYNRLIGEWVNYWKMIDPPGSERAELASFHRMERVTSYGENCAPCHTSQLRAQGFAEAGVNCEMCHGPMADHARGGQARIQFKKLSPVESVRVCAQCHAQSAQRESSAFPPAYRRRPYAEFAPRAFYRDGRFKETTFLVEAFERSSCYRRGGATCVSCHAPHTDGAGEKGLRFPADPDRMCSQCHAADQFAVAKHTKHQAGSEGARCAACHMPKIMNSLLFQAGSHQIDEKPSAAMTARFGQKDSPNACLLCHREKGVPWVSEQLRSW
ncbi:MAG: cytochrome c3 family protein [Bryobacteraceae bacterium]